VSPTQIPNDDFDDELLSALVDDELTAAERAQVEERLKSDSRARALVEELRALSTAVKSLPEEQLPRDLRSAVMASIARGAVDQEPVALSMPTSSERWALRRRGLVWSAIAIAAAVLLSVTQPPVEDDGEVAKRAPANAVDDDAIQERERKLFRSLSEADRPVRAGQGSPSLSAPAAPAATASQPADAVAIDKSPVSPDTTLGAGFGGGSGREADATKLDALAFDGEARASSVDGSETMPEPAVTTEHDAVESLSVSNASEPSGQPFAQGGRSGRPGDQRPSGSGAVVTKDRDAPSSKAKPPVVEITMARSDAISRFKQLAAENDIALSPANLTIAAESSTPGASVKAVAAGEILVEASPGQIDKLLFLCRSDNAFAQVGSPDEERPDQFFAGAAATRHRGEALEGALSDESTTRSSAALTENSGQQQLEANLGERKESGAKINAADAQGYGAYVGAALSSPKKLAEQAPGTDKDAGSWDESTRRFVLFRFLPAAPPAVTQPVAPAASPASK